MNEEITQNLTGNLSLEEPIFALLDSIDARVHSLEEQAERHSLENKSAWERLLAEILQVKERLTAL